MHVHHAEPEDVVGLLGNGQILGTGARGPNPAGMEVLTFGMHVAEVAVDVETGEVTVDRIAAIRQRALRHPRLILAGNAFDGVGIPDCVRSGQDAAEAILAALADPAAPAAA